MKNALFVVLMSAALASAGFSAENGPDIRIINDKVSIQAEAVPLSRLLRLLDQATGMKSKVPPELANRNVSVRFSDLSFDDAVRKIFEGLPLDYVLIQGQGIVVTGTSQPVTATAGAGVGAAAPYTPPPPQDSFVEDNPPFLPPQIQMQNQMQNQPAMINTPFGPRPNPNAAVNPQIQQQQGIVPGGFPNQQPVNNGLAPMVAPGQPTNNPFNSTLPGFNNTPGTNNNTLPPNSPFGTNPVFPVTPTGTTPQGYQVPPGYQVPLPPTRPIP